MQYVSKLAHLCFLNNGKKTSNWNTFQAINDKGLEGMGISFHEGIFPNMALPSLHVGKGRLKLRLQSL